MRSQNLMISHEQMKHGTSAATYWRTPRRSALNVQGSRFKLQSSKFKGQGLPQKNAKHAKDAAGIALPGSLSSLRSFAAPVPAPEDRRTSRRWMFDVRCSRFHAHRFLTA